MLNTVRRYISQHHLMRDGGRYLVALSGGADSVALLRILLALNRDVQAAHCNFHLRGDESDRDEAFCHRLCLSLGVPLHVAHFDTRTYADIHHVSIEMAARELRYDYFNKLLADLSLDGVCVAHHRDDSVETLLLNMVRGTGVEGLKGIAPRNGNILRPLLCVSRQDILDYLADKQQPFVTDSSNLVGDVQRNKIRLNVIPELLKVNPSAVANIQRLTQRVSDTLLILDQAIAAATRRVSTTAGNTLCINIRALLDEPGAESILWHLLKDRDFTSAQVKQIFSNITAQSGREWQSSTHMLLIDRGTIIVEPANTCHAFEMAIPEPGIYRLSLPSARAGETVRLRVTATAIDKLFTVSTAPNSVSLDAAKVAFPLTVRTVSPGDAFVPFGMKGKKLLSDFLTDRKLTLFEKRRQLVVADARGTIVWVVGIRPDERCRVTEETTRTITLDIMQ